MLHKKTLFALLFVSSTLFAKCENSIEFDVFLKETTKLEETISFQKNKIALLEKETSELKNKIALLEKSAKEKTVTKAEQFYKIAIPESNIYTEPKQESFSPYSLFKDERVQIESCDEHGWCQLLNKKLFIKKFAIIPAN